MFHYDNGFIITTDEGFMKIPVSKKESTDLVKRLLNHLNTVDSMNPPKEPNLLPPKDYVDAIRWFEYLKYSKLYESDCVLFASNSLDGEKSCTLWLLSRDNVKSLNIYLTLDDLVELMCMYL